MNIWHIDNKVWPAIRLWRMDKENFQVIEKGVDPELEIAFFDAGIFFQDSNANLYTYAV